MSLDRVKQLKGKKPFAKWDIFVYSLLLVFIVLLFVFLIFLGDHSELRGFCVKYDGKVVYSYAFSEGGKKENGWEEKITEEREGGTLLVTIRTEEDEYNILTVDLAARSVKMYDTNCSRHRDCMYMLPISDNSGYIVCMPHNLRVEALDADSDIFDPSLG